MGQSTAGPATVVTGVAKKQRSGYNAKAMAEIRNSLQPFKQPGLAQQLLIGLTRPGSSASIASSSCSSACGGYSHMQNEEEFQLSHRDQLKHLTPASAELVTTNTAVACFARMPRKPDHTAPPALPPRQATMCNRSINISNGDVSSGPPPLPPPRMLNVSQSSVPPMAPSRGTTPPPNSAQNLVSQISTTIKGSNYVNHQPSVVAPAILRRLSPVPSLRNTPSVILVTKPTAASQVPITHTRGTSPVSRQPPLIVHNSRQVQQHVAQHLQALTTPIAASPFDQNEPPPPYPMGTGAILPTYSQSLAMRLSPTLSSNSSDNYRRSSPAPSSNIILYQISSAASAIVTNGGGGGGGTSPSPSTISATSSRSSMQAWSARQAKMHSPIIVQSAKSTQVHKPVLQTATALASQPLVDVTSKPQAAIPCGSNPPPSYEFSMQQKQQAAVDTSTPTSVSRNIHQELPPPPPYPSTAVASGLNQGLLVSATSVAARASPVINTAKVVPNTNMIRSLEASKPPLLQRKGQNTDADSLDMPPPSSLQCNTTHHTSPVPERRIISTDKEEDIRKQSPVIKNCPPHAFKFFMEQHIENVLKAARDRRQRMFALEKELRKFDISKDPTTCDEFRKMLQQKETNYLRLKRAKLNKKHFEKIKKIGEGAYGKVTLVRKVRGYGPGNYNDLYAMKTLKKSKVVQNNQVAHVIAEKDALAEADNEWIVKLFYSFQDRDNLYFVMEYIPGGDLMTLLINMGIFDEALARFYIAELTCAVESVHNMGFIHRDIKPDNILIDARGHIKLTDFGLCTGFRWTHDSKYWRKGDHNRQDSMDPGNLESEPHNGGLKPLERRRQRDHLRCTAQSLVGTPNYIAPEVLLSKLHGQRYNQGCDWWSVGVILYEMVVGQCPFQSQYPSDTQRKIVNWEQYLSFPVAPKVSPEAQDLILRLCTNPDSRLGRNGTEEIKNHKFFRSHIDWSRSLREIDAPYKPPLDHPLDTQNFEPPECSSTDDESDKEESPEGEGFHVTLPASSGRSASNDDSFHGFYEFTFRRFFDESGHPVYGPSYPRETESESGSAGNESVPDPVFV